MKTGFGLDRFGKTTFGWTDFYYPQIVENIPKFYLYDEDEKGGIKHSDFYKFINIFSDIFDDVFYRLDKVDRTNSFLWLDNYIHYFSGGVCGVFDIGDKWIRINQDTFSDFLRIGFSNGWFFKLEDKRDIYLVYRYEQAGFGTDRFGLDEIGAIFGGAYIYIIPEIKYKIGSGFGFDMFGNSKFGCDTEYRIEIVRYDLYTYLAKNFGLNIERYSDGNLRFMQLVDNLYRNEVRGHTFGYEISALIYGFLINIFETYKIVNFDFFKSIDLLNNSNPYRYLFRDNLFKAYYDNSVEVIDGISYIRQVKNKYYPYVLVMDNFECDPDSNNSLEAKNYPSLDVFGWMVNTENPDNYEFGIPSTNNLKTYFDNFSYYIWEYCNRYYSKYAGLIVNLYQQGGLIPNELSGYITDRVIRYILEVKPIHIKFLKFVMNLVNSGYSINVNLKSYSGMELLNGYLDALAHYDNTPADDLFGVDNITDERPKLESGD